MDGSWTAPSGGLLAAEEVVDSLSTHRSLCGFGVRFSRVSLSLTNTQCEYRLKSRFIETVAICGLLNLRNHICYLSMIVSYSTVPQPFATVRHVGIDGGRKPRQRSNSLLNLFLASLLLAALFFYYAISPALTLPIYVRACVCVCVFFFRLRQSKQARMSAFGSRMLKYNHVLCCVASPSAGPG